MRNLEGKYSIAASEVETKSGTSGDCVSVLLSAILHMVARSERYLHSPCACRLTLRCVILSVRV